MVCHRSQRLNLNPPVPGQYENPPEKFSVGQALSGACDNPPQHHSGSRPSLGKRMRLAGTILLRLVG